MPQPLDVRRAGKDDVPAIVDTLVRAFEHDPFVRWIVRSGPGREVRVERYFRMVLERLTLPHDTVWVADGAASVALWTPPGEWELALAEQIRLLPEVTRIVGWARLAVVGEGLSRVERQRPPGAWYFLALLGTRPEMQGRGLGSAVMAPVLERCDAEGVSAVLDTCREANVGWYRKHGFEVVGEASLPEDGPRCWTMCRPPRPRL